MGGWLGAGEKGETLRKYRSAVKIVVGMCRTAQGMQSVTL